MVVLKETHLAFLHFKFSIHPTQDCSLNQGITWRGRGPDAVVVRGAEVDVGGGFVDG